MNPPPPGPGPRTTARAVGLLLLGVVASGCPSRRDPGPAAAGTDPTAPDDSSLAGPSAPPLSAAALPSAPPAASVAPRSEVTLSLIAEHEGGPGASGFTSIYLELSVVGLRILVRRSNSTAACRLDTLGADRWAVSCAPLMRVSVVEILRQGDALEIKPDPAPKVPFSAITLPAGAAIRLGAVEASGRTVPGGACPEESRPRPVRLEWLLFTSDTTISNDSTLWLRNTSTDAMLVLGKGAQAGECEGTIDGEKATIECPRAKISCALQGEPSSVLVTCGGAQTRTGRLLLPCGAVPRLDRATPHVSAKYH